MVHNPKLVSYVILFIILIIMTVNVLISIINYYEWVPATLRNVDETPPQYHLGLSHIVLGSLGLIGTMFLIIPVRQMTSSDEEELEFHRVL